ncbi:Tigger transposable element-derived protein 6 [Dictyocoela muelleri]|nr:Tigger transposable element-derived protein 6 [Dictyocoela muelleri]
MTKQDKSSVIKGLTLQQKMEIIEYKKSNKDLKNSRIAEYFSSKFNKNIDRRSIKNYMNKEELIKGAYIENPNRKSVPKNIKYSILDTKLKEWVDLVGSQGGFITEKLLKAKAISIFEKFEAPRLEKEDPDKVNFNASNVFLYKFKKRHGIAMKYCSGESFYINNQNYDEFIIVFKNKLSEYGKENVYNCDETGLFYKLALKKSLVKQAIYGIKGFKDRITVMLACNMTGTKKLKPVVIGKFANPRAPKGFDKKFFCDYFYNESAWMRSTDFNRWLLDFNAQCKKESRKILLLLDNCSSHKVSCDLTNIELLFLPKNSTSRLQPLDAGIIRSFKSKFYHHQLTFIVSDIGVHIEDLYKKINIKDAITYCKYAWDEVTKEKNLNCWKKALCNDPKEEFCDERYNYEETIEQYEEVIKHLSEDEVMEQNDYIFYDPNIVVASVSNMSVENYSLLNKITDDKIIPIEAISEIISGEDLEEKQSVTIDEAINCLKIVKTFAFEQNLNQYTYEAVKHLENLFHSKNKEKNLNHYLITLINKLKIVCFPPDF